LPTRDQLRDLIMRHRFTLRDVFGIGALLAAGALFAWQIDVFPNETARVHEHVLELDELLGLGALGFALFSGSRLAAQRRELRRRIAAEQKARSLAMEDPLTGLANRRRFEEALGQAAAAPPGRGSSHAVFMLDMNGFKKINDVHGHPVGDEVLVEVAARLRQAVRDGDLVARLGGDEFAILAPHLASAEAATGIGRRIIELMDRPVAAGGSSHPVGAAIGIGLIPQDGDSGEVVRKADIALYRAKAERSSTLRFFEEDMDAQVRERDQLERALRAAIEAGDIRPHYQPQLDLQTGQVIGFEALARWRHAELGDIPPTRFIPVAEDCGLIDRLSDQLLRQACTDAAAWPAEITLSFNISPLQLRDHTLGLRLMAILAETGLAPHRLEIELTESALVRDMDHAQKVLGEIRQSGVRIALYDFGTGYSSLYHLRAFKLDKIKIDRSFIEDMRGDPEAAAIVRALVGLGAGLNLAVVAEGVETAEQQAALRAQGCAQGQGFLYGEAIPAEAAAAVIAQAQRKAG
jgi:diguanylate cyclase (GGDEF)-like protein